MGDVIDNITATVEASNTTVNTLITSINSYEFGSDNIINKVIGTFRYLVGEPVFMCFVFIISVSMGFLIYKLIIKIFKLLSALIPGFGKINLS